jgi:hypothetical protein
VRIAPAAGRTPVGGVVHVCAIEDVLAGAGTYAVAPVSVLVRAIRSSLAAPSGDEVVHRIVRRDRRQKAAASELPALPLTLVFPLVLVLPPTVALTLLPRPGSGLLPRPGSSLVRRLDGASGHVGMTRRRGLG